MHHLKREKNPAAVTNFKPTGHLYRHLLFLDKQHDETTEAEIEHSRGRVLDEDKEKRWRVA